MTKARKASDDITDKERIFAAAYVDTGSATEAAIKAGSTKASARVAGHRMLKRKRVQEEISRLRAKIDNAVNKMITVGIAKHGPTGPTPGEMNPDFNKPTDGQIETAVAAVLNRAWVVSRMMINTRIAMGEQYVKERYAKKTVKPDGTEIYEVVELNVTERDAHAANQGLGMLIKEVDHIEGLGKQSSFDDDARAREEEKERLERLLGSFRKPPMPRNPHTIDGDKVKVRKSA